MLASQQAEKRPVETSPLQRSSPPQLKSVDEELLEKVLRDERPDPFDPEEFNRLMHREAER
jgi:hypothetical protein